MDIKGCNNRKMKEKNGYLIISIISFLLMLSIVIIRYDVKGYKYEFIFFILAAVLGVISISFVRGYMCLYVKGY